VLLVEEGTPPIERAVEALAHGAQDILVEPVLDAELLMRVHAAGRTKGLQDEIVSQSRRLEALLCEDALTGLSNRRFVLTQLAGQVSGARRHARPLSVAIVDVDHFKTFNDEHGHDVGDQVLRMVASRLRKVGGGGTAYRSGGEEFTLVFPGVEKKEALDLVEAVRDDVANARFALRNLPRPPQKRGQNNRGYREPGTQLQVTISVGVASDTDGNEAPETLLRAADEAMYRAKSAGRNRVMA
jgi:two-component system, cell cycle response regulator